MDDIVIATERERGGGASVSDKTVADFWDVFREYDIYVQQNDKEYGDIGYDFQDVLPTFEQVATSAVYLANDAAAFVTGEIHIAGGGMAAQ